MRLRDKVVVLTGAAGGIGRVLTQRFLKEGATVVGVDASEDKLETLRAAFEDSQRLLTMTTDVGDEARCRALAADVRSRVPRVDILVNNAGYFPTCDFRAMSYEDWRAVMRVNLDSVFLVTTAFLPLIEGRGWGRIINIGSGSVFRGGPRQVHYVSAKAGVIGFTRSLARALGPQGITVNVVAPGLTSTPAAIESLGETAIANRRFDRAIQREQEAEDVVGAVLFLSSTDSDFITGQTLAVDGGANML